MFDRVRACLVKNGWLVVDEEYRLALDPSFALTVALVRSMPCVRFFFFGHAISRAGPSAVFFKIIVDLVL